MTACSGSWPGVEAARVVRRGHRRAAGHGAGRTRRAVPCARLLLAALACVPAAGLRVPSATAAPPTVSVIAATAATTPVTVEPRKRIYLANDDHTDYMWSGTDAQYRTAFQNMLDYYMAQAEATASNPPDARGRFNCDGSLWVWEYERNRPAADFDRLIQHLRGGTITMPLQPCTMLYGSMPAEAVLRSMYYAGRLERRAGLRFSLVEVMENQTMPGGLASLWAGSGARYSWQGICGCATRIDAAHRPREIYQFRGPDGSSVCMRWNSWVDAGSIGGYAEARDLAGAVHYLDSDPGFLSRWPWPVSAAFGYGGDDLQTTTNAFITASLTLSDSTRRVIVSNEIDFFEDFLAHHAGEIPVFSGGFGNEWDLQTATMAEVTADFKRHVEKLRTAEALATVASLLRPSFMHGRDAVRDSAFLACGLFYEHDWVDVDNPIHMEVRAQFARDRLRDLKRYVNPLLDDARAAVAALVAGQPGVERHLVFNPLSWVRTDIADLAVSTPWPVHVVDVPTGSEVPAEAVTVDGGARVRILAREVPSVGYRVYEVRPGAGTAFPPSASVSLPWVDNGFYRVTLGSRGQLASMLDHKDGDRQLVAAGAAIHDFGSGSGAVALEHLGPVSTTLRVVARGSPDHETRVTLYGGIDRVDIEGLVTENFSSDQSYVSAFALEGASMRHEEVGMISRVARKAQGGDYANENTRTDYLTLNHFVDLSQPARGVTLSNWDSPFFVAGTSTVTVLDSTPVIRAVVGAQPDGPGQAIPDQGGDTRFLNRFSLRTHGVYDPAAAMRFALEHQNPLVATPVAGASGAPLPADQWSLLALSSPDILLWALKPAEEGIGQGIIARVWNLADAPRDLRLQLSGEILCEARVTTHIETDLGPAAVVGDTLTDRLERQQLRTYRLITDQPVLCAPGHAGGGVRLAISPNPMRPGLASSIAYTLPAAGPVRLTVHDVRGAVVARLVDGMQGAGPQTARWNGRGTRGAVVAPGVYLIRLETGSGHATGKCVFLK